MLNSKNVEQKINTQYDQRDFAREYHLESNSFKEKDPGREFLYNNMNSINRNSIVLDIGCGSGIDLQKYIEIGFVNLTGIDPSVNILKEAKALNPDITFNVGTFDNIPINDSSIDVVVSRHALHYSKDIQKALAEVYRVLKPGGIFIAVVSNPKFDSTLKQNDDDNIVTTLFKGKVTITFPKHFVEEYFGDGFVKSFDLLEKFEYNGPERDDYIEGANNTLAFVAKKKHSIPLKA